MKRSRTLSVLAAVGLLSACSGTNESQSTLLRVVRTLPANEEVTLEESARDRELLRDFQTNLRTVVPGVRIQPSLYSTTSIQSNLKRQTNSGLGPDLVISDAHVGLTKAIRRQLQGCVWQRCRVHFMRNLGQRVGRRKRASFLALAKHCMTTDANRLPLR